MSKKTLIILAVIAGIVVLGVIGFAIHHSIKGMEWGSMGALLTQLKV